MRRLLALCLAATALAACGDAPTPPAARTPSDEVGLASAFGAAGVGLTGVEFTAPGVSAGIGGGTLPGPDIDAFAAVGRLPAALRRTAEQQERIRELTEAFVAATRADRTALESALRELRAPAPGQPPAQFELERLRRLGPMFERLGEAQRRYHTGVLAVLTPEQRAWLEAERARERARWQACQQNPLTDAQRERVAALTRGFDERTRADREALAPILRQAAEARRAGRTEAEVRAILEPARPIQQRLAAAQAQLRTDLLAILTPAQRAKFAAANPGGGRGDGRPGAVWVLNAKGEPERRPVRTRTGDDEFAALAGGAVKAGDKVITGETLPDAEGK